MNSKIKKAQEFLRKHHVEGWLLYDFHGINEFVYDFLNFPKDHLVTRRFFYFIPKVGTPVKIVHKIESKIFDSIPGETILYHDIKSLKKALSENLEELSSVAMEYSPMCGIPYLSKVDAGTVELIKSTGCDVISSAPVLQYFNSTLSEEQMQSQKNAGSFLVDTVQKAFEYISSCMKSKKTLTEYDLQQWIYSIYEENNFMTDHDIVCAFAENTADPHYVPKKGQSKTLEENQLVLLDIFAKEKKPNSIYGDICHLGFTGKSLPKKIEKALSIIKEAQDEALSFISQRLEEKRVIKGFEVDEICRNVIKSYKMQDHFTHRTGHNLYTYMHGPGAHFDSFETVDERPIIDNTAYTIEPGLYFDGDFGVRLEINILVTNGELIVTAPMKKIINYLI